MTIVVTDQIEDMNIRKISLIIPSASVLIALQPEIIEIFQKILAAT